SEEHTSELQSLTNLVCRLLLEKKKKKTRAHTIVKDLKPLSMLANKSSPEAGYTSSSPSRYANQPVETIRTSERLRGSNLTATLYHHITSVLLLLTLRSRSTPCSLPTYHKRSFPDTSASSLSPFSSSISRRSLTVLFFFFFFK